MELICPAGTPAALHDAIERILRGIVGAESRTRDDSGVAVGGNTWN